MVCASFCSVVHRVRALVPSSVGLETVSEIWSQCGLFGGAHVRIGACFLVGLKPKQKYDLDEVTSFSLVLDENHIYQVL